MFKPTKYFTKHEIETLKPEFEGWLNDDYIILSIMGFENDKVYHIFHTVQECFVGALCEEIEDVRHLFKETMNKKGKV